jgi:IS5 family transposase
MADKTRTVRSRARSINANLRRRNDDKLAEVKRINAELADIAVRVACQADAVVRNARRKLRLLGAGASGRARAAVDVLERTAVLTRRIAAQTRERLSGHTPAGANRVVSLHDADARPICKRSLAIPTQFGYTGQVTDNRDGIIVDYEIQAGMPPDAPRLAPAIARAITAAGIVPDAVTADRGYGQASVEIELNQLGVELVSIRRKGQPGIARQQAEAEPGFVELIKWRTGAEGHIAALKRQHGWGPARLRGLEGTRIWCGWGILSHNAIKIAALIH